MKNIQILLVYAFTISIVFCGKDEKYSLIFLEPMVGEKLVQKSSEKISFNLPGIGYVESITTSTSVIEFLGTEGDFWKFRATLTDVENNNIINGLIILDQYAEAIEDKSCYLYVKSSGFDDEIHHIETAKEEDYYLQEAFEAAYMNITPNHFRYPFGINAVDVVKGDSWNFNIDSVKFYVNMGSPSSLGSFNPTLTLRKIKEKRDRKIAYIDYVNEVDLDLRMAVNYLGERRLITGHATGVGEGKFQWDIVAAKHLSQRLVVNLSGDFEMEGEKVFMKVFMRTLTKKVE